MMDEKAIARISLGLFFIAMENCTANQIALENAKLTHDLEDEGYDSLKKTLEDRMAFYLKTLPEINSL